MDFLVHNGSRARKNRTLRATQPVHGGHKQYVMGSSTRLIRNRPVRITEDALQQHYAELLQKESEGLIYLTTTAGVPFDLATLTTQPVAAESPPPAPPLDSAANDKPGGVEMGLFPQELPPPKEFEMPVPPPEAAFEMAETELPPLVPVPTTSRQDQPKRKGGR